MTVHRQLGKQSHVTNSKKCSKGRARPHIHPFRHIYQVITATRHNSHLNRWTWYTLSLLIFLQVDAFFGRYLYVIFWSDFWGKQLTKKISLCYFGLQYFFCHDNHLEYKHTFLHDSWWSIWSTLFNYHRLWSTIVGYHRPFDQGFSSYIDGESTPQCWCHSC